MINISRFVRRDKGVAAIEFAIILPVLLLTFLGLYDVGELIYCNVKVNRTAQNLNNVITRGDLTNAELTSIMQAAPLLMQPFDFSGGNGNVIVTSVSNPSGNGAQIMWRRSSPGGTGGSRVNPGALPGNLILSSNETIIFTEVFYTFQPFLPGYVLSLNTLQVYALAAGVPRKGQMTTLP